MKKIFLIIFILSSFVWGEIFKVSKEDICLIRKVKVYKEPSWIASIKIKSGETIYFSSPKSMFEFYFRPEKWPEHKVEIDEEMIIHVTNYPNLEKINAKNAYYVYGSNYTSPGGDDLVAFKLQVEAQEFANKHNGRRIFHFKDVSFALINYLNDEY